MKKILALFLACTMVLGLAACGGKQKQEAPTTEEAVASMQAPIDALGRCMLENQMDYDPQNPDFFWTALYYFAGAYGMEHEGVEEIPDTYQLKVPKAVMEEYAIALFSSYQGLPDLPSIMKGNVSYDPDEDAYFLSRGDIGLSEMRLTDVEETEDGYTLIAELWGIGEEETLIASWDVSLIRNTFSPDLENPLYLCSVASMQLISDENTETPEQNGNAEPSAETATAVFNGLSDSHSAEVTMPDNSIRVFQFDPASDVAKLLEGFGAGDGFTFTYETDDSTGASYILTIE